MIVSARNLVKNFGERSVLKNVTLEIEKPLLYGLLGPNGAGKTTLVYILLGILEPDSGNVEILGSSPKDPRVRSKIGYCPQEPALHAMLTGIENIAFYARLYGLNPKRAIKGVSWVIDALDLKEYLNVKVGKYSGGTMKKLSLVIALIGNPELLILDEPTTGMDPVARREVWHFLEKLRREGITILLTTHYMEEADRLSDRVGIINKGVIIAEGSPEELKKRYGPKSKIVIDLVSPPREDLLDELRHGYGIAYLNGNRINVHVEDPDEALPEIVLRILKEGGKINSIKISRPSLEDVFLRITGRRLRD